MQSNKTRNGPVINVYALARTLQPDGGRDEIFANTSWWSVESKSIKARGETADDGGHFPGF
jgi:hypothetical protein